MKKTDYYGIYIQKLKYRRYSDCTISSYGFYVKEFLNHLDTIGVSPTRITATHFQEYLLTYGFSSNSKQNQVISSIKLFYTEVLKRKYGKVDFKRPRGEKNIPKIINHGHLVDSIEKIKNLKHKSIISLAYSCGLRISEVVNMKIENIDSVNMTVHIKNAKGRKDRIGKLSVNTLETLRAYYRLYKPKVYLFNGQRSLKYSQTSMRNIVRKYIGDHNFHQLRHSYATYLTENDISDRKIADLLGHKSTKTVRVYQHLTSNFVQTVPSPI